MNNVIKRRKTANYTQINNFPVQQDLQDLSAIGLLTYIMSLPEDWTLYKTQLQNHFTRRKVDSAWKILVEKNYAIGFSCYVSGHKKYFYMVSDIAFTEQDFNDFVAETINELKVEVESILHPQAIKDSNFKTVEEKEKEQEKPDSKAIPTDVQNVQYTGYSTCSTSTKEIQTKEKNTNKDLLTIVNLQENSISSEKNNSVDEKSNVIITDEQHFREQFTDICNSFYTVFAAGRWSKKQWNTLINKFVTEIIENKRYKNIPEGNMRNYASVAIEKMAKHVDLRKGTYNPLENISDERPFYDWLNNQKEEA
jgi:hypothetical protein